MGREDNPAADSLAQAIDDVCVVTAAMADGDPLDAPDVAPCLHRLRLHREGRTQSGYPTRSAEELAERPRRITK